MRRDSLLILANVVAVFTVLWMWTELNASKRAVDQATVKLQNSIEFAAEIESLRTDLSDRVVITEPDYDPSIAVSAAVKKAKLYAANFSSREVSSRKIDQTGAKKCRVSLPQYRLTLRQLVNLVSCLADSEAKFQVASVTISRPSTEDEAAKSNSVELWDVTFDEVVYLKSEEKGGR